VEFQVVFFFFKGIFQVFKKYDITFNILLFLRRLKNPWKNRTGADYRRILLFRYFYRLIRQYTSRNGAGFTMDFQLQTINDWSVFRH
jgi:hypothetical protein